MSRISSPGTPFSSPLALSSSRVSTSSFEKATTYEPMGLNGTWSVSHRPGIAAVPSTLSLALRVPGIASKPAWTMALLAFVVPIAMSLHFSTNATLMLYRLSSLATIAPLTPAPMIATSYDIFLPPDGNSMAGFTNIVIIPLFLSADKYIKRHNLYFCRYICSQFMTI